MNHSRVNGHAVGYGTAKRCVAHVLPGVGLLMLFLFPASSQSSPDVPPSQVEAPLPDLSHVRVGQHYQWYKPGRYYVYEVVATRPREVDYILHLLEDGRPIVLRDAHGKPLPPDLRTWRTEPAPPGPIQRTEQLNLRYVHVPGPDRSWKWVAVSASMTTFPGRIQYRGTGDCFWDHDELLRIEEP